MQKVDLSGFEYAEPMILFLEDHREKWEDLCRIRKTGEDLSIAEYIEKYCRNDFLDWLSHSSGNYTRIL